MSDTVKYISIKKAVELVEKIGKKKLFVQYSLRRWHLVSRSSRMAVARVPSSVQSYFKLKCVLSIQSTKRYEIL